LTLPFALFTLETLHDRSARPAAAFSGDGTVTKKEIVKQISERIGLTQLKTKEIVQQTFDAIVDTLLEQRRIELRNFGVFEVKCRRARKARNPKTGDEVYVPPKCVVTFKPGKEMEERVRQMKVAAAFAKDKRPPAEIEEVNGARSKLPAGDGARGGKSRTKTAHRVSSS
jgi:nucleoid DNA-binding protein